MLNNLYIIISSSLTHVISVIGIIYFIYEFFLIKKINNELSKVIINYFQTWIDLTYQSSNNNFLFPEINKNDFTKFFKNILLNQIPSPTENDYIMAKKNNDENFIKNKPINKKVYLFIGLLSLVLILWLIIFYFIFKKKINIKFAMFEIILSIIISFVIIFLYEYLFTYKFIFPYINYNIDTFLKTHLYFIDKNTNLTENIYNYSINNPKPKIPTDTLSLVKAIYFS